MVWSQPVPERMEGVAHLLVMYGVLRHVGGRRVREAVVVKLDRRNPRVHRHGHVVGVPARTVQLEVGVLGTQNREDADRFRRSAYFLALDRLGDRRSRSRKLNCHLGTVSQDVALSAWVAGRADTLGHEPELGNGRCLTLGVRHLLGRLYESAQPSISATNGKG